MLTAHCHFCSEYSRYFGHLRQPLCCGRRCFWDGRKQPAQRPADLDALARRPPSLLPIHPQVQSSRQAAVESGSRFGGRKSQAACWRRSRCRKAPRDFTRFLLATSTLNQYTAPGAQDQQHRMNRNWSMHRKSHPEQRHLPPGCCE